MRIAAFPGLVLALGAGCATLPPPVPPLAAFNIGPLAASMKSAAQNGTPFVCNCKG